MKRNLAICSFMTISMLVALFMTGCDTNPPGFIVSFNSNGGSAVSPITGVEGATIIKPEDPTKGTEALVGWYKEEGLINQWNFATDTVTASITLYAKWWWSDTFDGTI